MANAVLSMVTLTVQRLGDVTRWHMSSVAGRAAGVTVSAYVYRGVVVDTGFYRARRLFLDALSRAAVRGVVVTHWHEDHAGNAERVAAQGIPLLLRADTESMLRRRPAIQLYRKIIWGRPSALTGELIPFEAEGFECVHTPGHSPDHQVVWFPETRTLFSGDLWLGVRSRVYHVDEDPFQIVESLRRAAALEPERMFDAHRGEVANPSAALAARAEWLTTTLGDIERRIAAGATDAQIVRELFRGEEAAAYVSFHEYSRRNLVRAVRRRVAPGTV
ncbi:MAG: MBL fold metallo-hydrolase [Gemmatimonadaceae bacterium]